MRRHSNGQILPMVMISLSVLTIMIYGLISWIQNDTRMSVKQQKGTAAINLAEAALDRGQWKLQSTTTTWARAYAGTVIGGYNFDTTYYDVPGGTYRIKFSSAANKCVTIVGEGRDNSTNEVRALSAVYRNQTIYSGMMSGGNVTWAKGLGLFWGPIISQGNITLVDEAVPANSPAAWYFPRKYAKGTVIGTPTYPRDTSGINPPNTDNVEWWSAYSGVPAVPILDFVALRSSAAASGTLNVYGCGCAAAPAYSVDGTAVAAWDTARNAATCAADGDTAPHTNHLGNSSRFFASRGLDITKDYVWYWDGDVAFQGDGYNSNKATTLKGTVVVRGNLTINSSGDMVYTSSVPTNAWEEHTKLLVNTYDTAAAGEYPADTGYHQNSSTFGFGTTTWCQPGAGCGWRTTVGVRGLTYVGGNLNITNFMDFNGAVWVNGSVSAAYASNTAFCGVFYNDSLDVPALNVILFRQSWTEIAPSAVAWP